MRGETSTRKPQTKFSKTEVVFVSPLHLLWVRSLSPSWWMTWRCCWWLWWLWGGGKCSTSCFFFWSLMFCWPPGGGFCDTTRGKPFFSPWGAFCKLPMDKFRGLAGNWFLCGTLTGDRLCGLEGDTVLLALANFGLPSVMITLGFWTGLLAVAVALFMGLLTTTAGTTEFLAKEDVWEGAADRLEAWAEELLRGGRGGDGVERLEHIKYKILKQK